MGSSFFVADASRLGRKDGAWGFSGVYFSAVPPCNKSATSSLSLLHHCLISQVFVHGEEGTEHCQNDAAGKDGTNGIYPHVWRDELIEIDVACASFKAQIVERSTEQATGYYGCHNTNA